MHSSKPPHPLEHSTYWPTNRDADGVGTFLLPGETSIDTETLRRRTAAYYRQVRGNAMAVRPRVGAAAIAELKAQLATPSKPTAYHPDPKAPPKPPDRPL